MKIVIERYVSPETMDADTAGELLLDELTPPDQRHLRWGYSTTDYDTELYEDVPTEELSLTTLTHLLGCYAKDPNEIARVKSIRHKELGFTVHLHWDGDGCVVINLPDGNCLVNDDIKSPRYWEWNPDWVNDLPGWYYD